jgi:hypothetical protein
MVVWNNHPPVCKLFYMLVSYLYNLLFMLGARIVHAMAYSGCEVSDSFTFHLRKSQYL